MEPHGQIHVRTFSLRRVQTTIIHKVPAVDIEVRAIIRLCEKVVGPRAIHLGMQVVKDSPRSTQNNGQAYLQKASENSSKVVRRNTDGP